MGTPPRSALSKTCGCTTATASSGTLCRKTLAPPEGRLRPFLRQDRLDYQGRGHWSSAQAPLVRSVRVFLHITGSAEGPPPTNVSAQGNTAAQGTPTASALGDKRLEARSLAYGSFLRTWCATCVVATRLVHTLLRLVLPSTQ